MKVKPWKFLLVCVSILYAVFGSKESIEVKISNFNVEIQGSYTLITDEDPNYKQSLKTYRKEDSDYYLGWNMKVQDWAITLCENPKDPVIIAKRWYEERKKIKVKETKEICTIKNVGKLGILYIIKNVGEYESIISPKDYDTITDGLSSRKNVNTLFGLKNWIFLRNIDDNNELFDTPRFEKITMKNIVEHPRKPGFKDKRNNLIDPIINYSIDRDSIIQKTLIAFAAASNYYVDSKYKETWNEQIITEVQETMFKFMQVYELISEQFKGKKYNEYKKSLNNPERKQDDFNFNDSTVVQKYLVENFYHNQEKTTVNERERIDIILSMLYYSKHILQQPAVINHLNNLADNTTQKQTIKMHEENIFEIHFENSFMKIIPIDTAVNDFGIDNFSFQQVTIAIENNKSTDTQGNEYIMLRLMFETSKIDVAMFYPGELTKIYGPLASNNECILRFKSAFISFMMDLTKDIKPFNISSSDKKTKPESDDEELADVTDMKLEDPITVNTDLYEYEDLLDSGLYEFEDPFKDPLDENYEFEDCLGGKYSHNEKRFDDILDIPDFAKITTENDGNYLYEDIFSDLNKQSIEESIKVEENYEMIKAIEKKNQTKKQNDELIVKEYRNVKKLSSSGFLGADENFIKKLQHLNGELLQKNRKSLSKSEKEKLLNAYQTTNQYLGKKINYEKMRKQINAETKN